MDENESGLIKGKTDTLVASEVQKEKKTKNEKAFMHGQVKKKNLLTHTIWDSLGWGGCLETDMNGTSDQMVHQTIRIFGLRCDMYYV